jgi:hypothetical protein
MLRVVALVQCICFTGGGGSEGREGPAACRVFTGVIADLLYCVYQASERNIVDPNLKDITGKKQCAIMQWKHVEKGL